MTYRQHPAISLEVLDFISPKILRALRDASDNLTARNIRHAICGGIAVGAYGYVRATKDVDFLAGDEAFLHHGKLVSFAPGVTFAIDGIPTDMIPLSNENPNKDLSFLASELDQPYDFAGMPIVSPNALVAMKLVAHRRRDQDDILQILAAGTTRFPEIVSFLRHHARSDLLPRLYALVSDTTVD